MKTWGFAAAAAAAMGAAAPAVSAQIFSTGYDMPNGGGNASGGTFNYWDRSYSGAGATTTDGAALSGGSGDLTDGITASQYWFAVENGAGTGPYVGWYKQGQGAQADPVLTFHFSGNPVITSLSAHLDNTGFGGVFGPASVLVDGVGYSFTAPASGTIGWLTITGLNLTGNSHTVQFNQANNGWLFVSEVTFAGSVVPEPASWAMMIAGFGLVGAAMRRRLAAA